MLHEGTATILGNYILGGPDFLVEVESPEEDPAEMLPFYSAIGVRKLSGRPS
jgi:hypothetical protein